MATATIRGASKWGRMYKSLLVRRGLVAVVVLMLAGLLPMASAQGQTGPDYAIAWIGAIAARPLAIPGSSGGFVSYVIASFQLWLPTGGTWHVESSVTATGVHKATALGSIFGRVSFGHTLECGPDQLDAEGRLTTRAARSVTGRNLLYDETRTTTARTLWPTVTGYNRCLVVITLGRDDLAVAGKMITINSGFVRLVGRGLDNSQSVTAQGTSQTAVLTMPSRRFLGPATPTLTLPNFQIGGYVAPPQIADAAEVGVMVAVTNLDAIADASITTCYGSTTVRCPSINGTVLTTAKYQSSVVVQQSQADGTVCRQTASPWLTQSTYGQVHHLEARNRVSVVIDPTCTSRTFRVKLFVRWLRGNTFYIEASPLTRITIRPTSS